MIARLAQQPDEADLGADHGRDTEGYQQPSPSYSRRKREWATDACETLSGRSWRSPQ